MSEYPSSRIFDPIEVLVSYVWPAVSSALATRNARGAGVSHLQENAPPLGPFSELMPRALWWS